MGIWDMPARHYTTDTELRFNPYHDPQNGRFTTAGGGSGGGFLYSKGGKNFYVFDAANKEKSSANLTSEEKIKNLDKKINGIKEQLAEIVKENGSAQGLPDKYYDLQKQRNSLESERGKEFAKIIANRKPTEKKEHHTFINGWGEATKREITSLSYKQSQARLNKEFDSWFGVNRR